MDSLLGGLLVAEVREKRNNVKMTVLHRPNGQWYRLEISRLVGGLMTEASQRRDFPEYVILFGHYTKEQTLKALWGGEAYTATQVTGLDGAPFNPGWTM